MRRPLTGLLLAQVVSIAGTRMSMIALPWFVLETTGSAVRMGLVAFAEMAAYVACAVLAAPVVDRLGARRASVVCDASSVAAVGLVPLLEHRGLLALPVLLALVAAAGALRGPGDNAKYVLLPAAAGAEGVALARATGLYDGVSRTASLVGAPLAGLLIGVLGAPAVLAVDAATFGVAALVIAALVPPSRSAPEPDAGTYLARLADGARFLLGQRLLLAIALMILVTNLLDQAYSAVLLPLWSSAAGHEATGVGLVSGCFALGATVGSLGMATVATRLPRRRLVFLLAFLVTGAPRFVVAACGAPLAAVLVVAVVSGLAAGTLNPILGLVQLERIPERLRARVISASMAVGFAGIPLGGLLAGWAAGAVGVRGALLGAGVAYLLATLAPLGRTWRALDDEPAPGAVMERVG